MVYKDDVNTAKRLSAFYWCRTTLKIPRDKSFRQLHNQFPWKSRRHSKNLSPRTSYKFFIAIFVFTHLKKPLLLKVNSLPAITFIKVFFSCNNNLLISYSWHRATNIPELSKIECKKSHLDLYYCNKLKGLVLYSALFASLLVDIEMW